MCSDIIPAYHIYNSFFFFIFSVILEDLKLKCFHIRACEWMEGTKNEVIGAELSDGSRRTFVTLAVVHSEGGYATATRQCNAKTCTFAS